MEQTKNFASRAIERIGNALDIFSNASCMMISAIDDYMKTLGEKAVELNPECKCVKVIFNRPLSADNGDGMPLFGLWYDIESDTAFGAARMDCDDDRVDFEDISANELFEICCNLNYEDGFPFVAYGCADKTPTLDAIPSVKIKIK